MWGSWGARETHLSCLRMALDGKGSNPYMNPIPAVASPAFHTASSHFPKTPANETQQTYGWCLDTASYIVSKEMKDDRTTLAAPSNHETIRVSISRLVMQLLSKMVNWH